MLIQIGLKIYKANIMYYSTSCSQTVKLQSNIEKIEKIETNEKILVNDWSGITLERETI